jgi:hypothetical protein
LRASIQEQQLEYQLKKVRRDKPGYEVMEKLIRKKRKNKKKKGKRTRTNQDSTHAGIQIQMLT